MSESTMDIRLYNSHGGKMELFKPVRPGHVYMYNCGPTVYDFAHIGNFRSFLFVDLLRRFMEFVGYDVHQVMNITDVGHMTEDDIADGGGEDKMQVAAQRLNEAKKAGVAPVENPNDPYQVAAYYAEAFITDARMLNMKVAFESDTNMPAATDNVDNMIKMIETLVEKEHAYVASDGAVYFDTQSFEGYGKLSGNLLEQTAAGAGGRIDTEQQSVKKHPSNFLLWKPDESHIMKWDSPWGTGYPGWHIECSAMSRATLGVDTLDIHTGGEDNKFPHHECEIAQSECCTGEDYVNYWLHARHLMIEGEKMSKSKGNFYTLRDLLKKGVKPEEVRLELIKAPYRQNANFTVNGLKESRKWIKRLRALAETHPEVTGDEAPALSTEIEKQFAQGLAIDLNIAKSMGALSKWLKSVKEPTAEDVSALRRIDRMLGVIDPVELPEGMGPEGMTDAEIDGKVAAMNQARIDKDYSTSDSLRDELIGAGIQIQMTRDGVEWEREILL